MIEIKNNEVYSTEGRKLHRLGSDTYFSRGTALPTDTTSDYEEVDNVPAFTTSDYETKVCELIRQRYSVNEEFAIQRKALTTMLHPEVMTLEENGEDYTPATIREFEAYNTYAEQCKAEAKKILSNPKITDENADD